MVKGITHAHLGPIWDYSEPSESPNPPNLDLFCRFLQQDSSNVIIDLHCSFLLPLDNDFFKVNFLIKNRNWAVVMTDLI